MLKTIYIYENVLDLSEYQVFETDNVLDLLMTKFDKWPDTGRIYHNEVSQLTDVTPSSESDIDRLQTLDGIFHCVIYPAAPIVIFYALIVILVLAVVFIRPSLPSIAQRGNNQQASPNNELSSRSNRARVNERIPDIFGTVRSTPDLIAPSYSVFESNQEVEFSLMCIGKGQYEIHDCYDGETAIDQISGSSVQAYRPFTPFNVGAPYYIVGSQIDSLFLNTSRSNSVNGQVLRPPNFNTFYGNLNVNFTYPNVISIPVGSSQAFDEYFQPGDTLNISLADKYENGVSAARNISVTGSNKLTIQVPPGGIPSEFFVGGSIQLIDSNFPVYQNTNPDDPDQKAQVWSYFLDGKYTISNIADVGGNYIEITLVNPQLNNGHWLEFADYGISTFVFTNTIISTGVLQYTLNGSYSVLTVSTTQITLNNPFAVNPNWNELSGNPFNNANPTLDTDNQRWVGPFILENVDRRGLICNFVALNGLYKDDGTNQYALNVEIQVEVTPINTSNVAIGPAETFSVFLSGSSILKDSRGSTLKAFTEAIGRCKIRATRITPSDVSFAGTIVDEVKWRDLLSMTIFSNPYLGNVTVVKTKTYATTGALAVKERKLNMLVTRQIPGYLGNGTFTSDLISTNKARDIIMFIAQDPKIGNRKPYELDFESINNSAYVEPLSYFGTEEATEFCYTFDKDNLSFEETMQIICNSVFSIAYRQGSLIRMSFEKATTDSTLLFNHRNKLPGSETRTVTFGNQNDNDGIELEYVSPDDDALVTFYLPTDRSAVNPKKIETAGIRNYNQAYFQAWRYYNKLRYQNTQVEFEATEEADLSIPGDRILVADNTRTKTQDGDIKSQSGLVVYTSQRLQFEPGVSYTMFLQLSDGSTDAIPVAAGPSPASATLSAAPRLPLAVESGLSVKTTYILVGSNNVRQTAFLVAEKVTQENKTSKIRAGNYDARFYEHDKDFINGLL